jgi:hypothetical protein
MLLRVQCTLRAQPKEELQTKLVLAQVFSTHYAYQIDSINFFVLTSFVCYEGCFWGTEKFFKDFGNANKQALVSPGAVGFMGPPSAKPNPSYYEVILFYYC